MAPFSTAIPSVLVPSFLLFFFHSYARTPFWPKALVSPVTKDATTLQYMIPIPQKTPLQTQKLVVDLGGRFTWIDCDTNFVSTSFHPISCLSPLCSATRTTTGCGFCSTPGAPGCYSHSCSVPFENTVTGTATVGHLLEDLIVLNSTDGKKLCQPVPFPRYVFSCAPTSLLQGLAIDAKGMAGLGRTRIALPNQLAQAFGFHPKFAICLASQGVIFFGEGPYDVRPGMELSTNLMNPVNTAANEYFIGVKAIKVNDKQVPVNTSLLSFNRKGMGGTKISTVDPYTTLETSIYRAVTSAFSQEASAMNISRVVPVKPFGVCFSTNNVRSTRAGPAVPKIDLVLESETSLWTILGDNSMVNVREGVLCLGLLDGGLNQSTSIIIGGHQLENILLQFDLANSRLGFRRTTCADFDFTSSG